MNYSRSFRPTPYKYLCSDDELEQMEKERKQAEQEAKEEREKEAREQILAWKTKAGNPISMHYDPEEKVIYFYIFWERGLDNYFAIKDLRRPTERERKDAPNIYAVLDNGRLRMALTKERYMALRAKLPEK